jgi:hypothetical protein
MHGLKAYPIFLAITTVVATLLACGPVQAADDAEVCGIETARQEKAQGIPDRLLHAISLVESGRWDSESRASFAWPWTVMAEGEGRFLPNKATAIAEVRKLQAAGVRNIDVGCMQVNLLAHPDAFSSLDEAFEPATNVAYAARFLSGLYDSTQNWPMAGAYYHSQTPNLAAAYKARLISTWETVKKHEDPRLQLASLDSSRMGRPSVGLWPMTTQATTEPRFTPSANDGSALQIPGRKSAAEGRNVAERAEAKRIADAYRQARLEEYRARKALASHG